MSTKPSPLPITWPSIPGDPGGLGPAATIDIRPRDLLFLPQDPSHSVDSNTESMHLAIGFTPLTVREALVAAILHLSDLDQALRLTVGGRVAFEQRGLGFHRLGTPVLDGAARLLAACRTPGFLGAAMQRRSARTVAMLAPLPTVPSPGAIDLDTALVQRPTALCHLTANAEEIDFSYPGGHVYIHRGASDSVACIGQTPRVRIRDIPGAVGDDVRLSLASKLLEVGFLELAPAPAARSRRRVRGPDSSRLAPRTGDAGARGEATELVGPAMTDLTIAGPRRPSGFPRDPRGPAAAAALGHPRGASRSDAVVARGALELPRIRRGRLPDMKKVAFAVVAAVLLAGAAESLAESSAAVTPRPKPSSYTPRPGTHQHVYGSPIESGRSGAARTPRAKPPTKHAKAVPAHNARPHPTKGRQPAPAPAPT